jgi:hypothetical protein
MPFRHDQNIAGGLLEQTSRSSTRLICNFPASKPHRVAVVLGIAVLVMAAWSRTSAMPARPDVLDLLGSGGDGVIERLEVQHGLPFRIVVEEAAA